MATPLTRLAFPFHARRIERLTRHAGEAIWRQPRGTGTAMGRSRAVRDSPCPEGHEARPRPDLRRRDLVNSRARKAASSFFRSIFCSIFSSEV